jgi:hypothetical protein
MRARGARGEHSVTIGARPSLDQAEDSTVGAGRPAYGGTVAVPVPTMTLPPVAGAGQVTGQLEGLALIAIGSFAVIGFGRGARREWVSLAATAAAYVAVERHWQTMAAWAGRAIAVVAVGPLKSSAAAAEAGAAGTHGGPGAVLGYGSAVWQVAFFAAVVVTSYLVSQRMAYVRVGGMAAILRLPDLVDRVMGALLGACTGYLAATFVLDRLFPALAIDLTGAGSLVAGRLDRLGPPAVFAVAALIILFGVLALESRGKRVYG